MFMSLILPTVEALCRKSRKLTRHESKNFHFMNLFLTVFLIFCGSLQLLITQPLKIATELAIFCKLPSIIIMSAILNNHFTEY